jgi:hypothetical protein
MWVIPVRAGGKKDDRQASGVTYEIVKVQVQNTHAGGVAERRRQVACAFISGARNTLRNK